LRVIDCEGLEAATARRLARELNISTRTLYKRIGNHASLIRNVTDRYVTDVTPEIRLGGSWRSAVLDWCIGLHRSMTTHPNLTVLLSRHDLVALRPHIDRLIESIEDPTACSDDAERLCHIMVAVTFSDAIASAPRGARPAGSSPESQELRCVLELILAGSRAPSYRESTT